MNIIRSTQELLNIIDESKSKTVFLLKHSLTCSVSSSVHHEYNIFAEKNPDIACYVVRIQENRDVSNHVAEITGIPHQSPQAILFSGGNAVWNESHWRISAESLKQALS